MLNCIKLFHKYLELEALRIRRNFADFGSDNSGTAYILRQITGAINHFGESCDSGTIPTYSIPTTAAGQEVPLRIAKGALYRPVTI